MSINVKFDSFLTTRIEPSTSAETSFIFTSPNTFSLKMKINDTPMPQPGDLIMGEYTIKNAEGDFNIVITTLTATVTDPTTALAVNTTASNINGSSIVSGVILFYEERGEIHFDSQGSFALEDIPSLGTINPQAHSPLTISFRLFINNGLYIVRDYPDALVTVIWQVLPKQPVTGFLNFSKESFGQFQLPSPFLPDPINQLNGTIAANAPNFNLFIVMEGVTTNPPDDQLSGSILPDSSHINNTGLQSTISGEFSFSGETLMLRIVFDNITFYNNPLVIPMLTDIFSGTILITQDTGRC